MTAQPPNRSRAWIARVAVAVATALILGAVLILAGQSGGQLRPAASVVAPPPCTKHDGRHVNVARDGFTLECGPGSAVVRSDGRWQVMKTGNCGRNDGWMYFGVHTPKNVPHTGLTLHITHARYPFPSSEKAAINGYIETGPAVKEPVSGTVRSIPRTRRGTFILRGRSSGATYIGGWTCASHESRPAAPVVAPPRCTKRDDRNQGLYRDGFWVVCGPASAVVFAAGRWQVMNTGVCDLIHGTMIFGARTTRDVTHAGLSLGGSPFDPRSGHNWDIYPGSVDTTPGVADGLHGGTAISAPGGRSGTFIAFGDQGDYIGAWDCERS